MRPPGLPRFRKARPKPALPIQDDRLTLVFMLMAASIFASQLGIKLDISISRSGDASRIVRKKSHLFFW